MCWDPCDNAVIRHIFGNHCTGCNNSIRADMNTTQNCAISTYPHIIADRYWMRNSQSITPLRTLQRMAGSGYQSVWPDHAIVSKSHFCAVKNSDIEIRSESISNMYVLAVITMKSRLNIQFLTSASKKGPRRQFATCGIGCRDGLKLCAHNRCIVL
ncbi:hypothetical protein BITS_1675 [Bifidobacterium tsurumiense]|uniref:Uncharacterized protein n=1 Tax=Bifidobacterium tsurumiense TaxID=356829 RepID=A0A087EBH9_9BIFI|nr:hypothetical protein BITS_1675 [Bifidobacterium tsurumiense]